MRARLAGAGWGAARLLRRAGGEWRAAEIAALEAQLRCDEEPLAALCGSGAELAFVLPPPLALRARRRVWRA